MINLKMFVITLFLLIPSLLYCQYLETTIPVGSFPRAFTYNQTNYKVYCANMGSNTITVINSWTNQIITTIRVGSQPITLVYNPINNKIYCANQQSNEVSIINSENDNVINTIPVGLRPTALAYDSMDNKVYCANSSSNNVTVIDGANDYVITTINVGYYPSTLLYNPTNNKIYCANMDNESVTIIDGATNQVITTIRVGVTPSSLAYNSENNKVYCASWANGRIHIINGATNQIIDSIIYGNSGSQSLIYHYYTNRIFYVNFTGDNIKAIDGTSDSIFGTIQFPFATRPYALISAFRYIYCANIGSHNVSVIDPFSLFPGITISVGYPVAFITGRGPNAIRIYVANLWSSDVSVIREDLPGIETNPIFTAPKEIFKLYPNPAKSFFAVRLPYTADRTALKIIDIYGKIIRVIKNYKSNRKVYLNDINPGVYFLQIDNMTKKLIITN